MDRSLKALISVGCGALLLALAVTAGPTVVNAQSIGTTPGTGPELTLPGSQAGGYIDVALVPYCADSTSGYYSANNLKTALLADGRFSTVGVIDGDVSLPTSAQILADYACVVTWTDSRCGAPTPPNVANSAADMLTGVAQGGGGVVLATFGFSRLPGGIGIGPSIFGPGLSPLQQATPIYNAPAGTVNIAGAASATECEPILDGVNANIYSSFANYVSVSTGATLCASYTNGQPFVAVSADRQVVGLNTFPPNPANLNDADYRLLMANAIASVCGPPPPPAQCITDYAVAPGIHPMVARQLEILANQVNTQLALAEASPPAQALHIRNSVRRLLDNWIDRIVPLFTMQGRIPAALAPDIIACLEDVRDSIP